jgi:hypothetical protein
MILRRILILPLLYFEARKISGKGFALRLMLFLAARPWHIMLSPWGLQSNFLLFVLWIAFTTLQYSTKETKWNLVTISFSLRLYAYGTVYLAFSLRLIPAIQILLLCRRVTVEKMVLGLMALAVVARLIGLFEPVNFLRPTTVKMGARTDSRLPASRFVPSPRSPALVR